MKPIGQINNLRRQIFTKTLRKQRLNSPTNTQKTKSVLHSKQSNKNSWKRFWNLFSFPETSKDLGENLAFSDYHSIELMVELGLHYEGLDRAHYLEQNRVYRRMDVFKNYKALPLMKHLDRYDRAAYPIQDFDSLKKNPFNISQHGELHKFIDSFTCIKLINKLLEDGIEYSALMVYAIRSSRKGCGKKINDKVAAVRDKYGI